MMNKNKGEDMTKYQMIKKLKEYIAYAHGTQADYAVANKVSPQMVNAVVTGAKEPTKWMLADIGLVKKVVKTISYEQA